MKNLPYKGSSALINCTLFFLLILIKSNSYANEWEIKTGAVLISPTNSHIVGEEEELIFTYYAEIAYGIFNISPEGIGITLPINTENMINMSLQIRDSVFNHDKNMDLAVLKKREESHELALTWTHLTPYGDLATSITSDLSNIHNGHSISMLYSRQIEFGNGVLVPRVEVEHQTKKLVDYYYGVSNKEENLKIFSYKGKATTNFSTGITHIYPFTSNWHGVIDISWQYFGKHISNSSIVNRNNLFIGAMGLYYQF